MRIGAFIFGAIVLISTLSFGSDLPTQGYIGLFIDNSRSGSCYTNPAPWTPLEMWIWCLPGQNGLIAAEFTISYPSNIIGATVTANPEITVSLGSLSAGISLAFGECQTDWVWTHHQTLYCMNTAPTTVSVVANPDAGAYHFANCTPGYPIESCTIYSNLMINQCWPHDLYPPAISWIRTLSETELEAQYCEAVTKESAENLDNYYVCEWGCPTTIPIAGITLLPDQKTVHISLGAPITKGIEYFLGYIDIEDLHGNVLDWRILINFGYIPDLVISNPWAEPDSIYLNTPEIEVGYKIRNSGNWPSGPFDATILWQSTDTLTMATISHDGLAAGDSLLDMVTIPVPAIKAGTNTLRCWVDYRDHVNEKDEHNNLATRSIFVYLPNLAIAHGDAVVEPDAISDGCTALRLRYRIKNLGPVDAGPFPASIRLSIKRFINEELLLTRINYPGLAAGASLTDSFTTILPPDIADNNSLGITLNDPRALVESSFNDNWGGASLPNYAPRIVSIEDLPNDAGDFVTITFYRCRSDVSHPEHPIVHYDIVSENSGAVIAEVPATESDYYSATAVSIGDSSSSQIPWSVYRVRAVRPLVDTADTAFHYSCPDSGYSIDNRIATFLQGFAVSLKELRIVTTWCLADGTDAPEFTVFRANSRDGRFIALPSSEIGAERLSFTFVDSDVEPGESYRYRIEYQEGGTSHVLFETQDIALPALPLTLFQNHPNPFNPSTTIRYYLPESCRVRLEIFDVGGRRVASLVERREEKGLRSVEWKALDENGRGVSSGIYFYRLTAGKKTLARKMILLK